MLEEELENETIDEVEDQQEEVEEIDEESSNIEEVIEELQEEKEPVYVPINTIEQTGNYVRTIKYIPYGQVWFLLVLGAALILVFRTAMFYILGGIMVALALIVLLFIKDHKCIDVYDDALVFFDNNDSTKAVKVAYNDIKQWAVKDSSTGSQVVMVWTKDNVVISSDSSQFNLFYKTMSKKLPNKEVQEIVRKEKEAAGKARQQNIKDSFKQKRQGKK